MCPRRLPSGKWQGIVQVGKHRHSPGHSFELKRDAKAWEEAERAKLRRGDWRDPRLARTSFGNWCERWGKTRGVEPETAVDDARTLANHVLPRWRTWPLGAIDRVEVQTWVTEMTAAGVGQPTVMKAYSLFRRCMEVAVGGDLIGRSPCRDIRLPEPAGQVLRWWTPQEVGLVVARLPEPHATIACLMCWCGMRWEEAAGLGTHQVDWLHRQITVSQVITSARRIKPYAKSRAGHRTVSMAGPVEGMLRPAWDAAVRDRGRDGLIWVARGKDEDGRPLALRTWGEVWRRRIRVYSVWDTSRPARGKAGRHQAAEIPTGRPWAVVDGYGGPVEWFATRRRATAAADELRAGELSVPYDTPHTLRHSGASWLRQEGVTLSDIQTWLGHGDPKSTAIYAHIDPARTAATIGEALAAAAKPRAAEIVQLGSSESRARTAHGTEFEGSTGTVGGAGE